MKFKLRAFARLLCVGVVAACATLVCTLFWNHQLDLRPVGAQITDPYALGMYEMQCLCDRVVSIVSGIGLGLTTLVLLLFQIKCEIDSCERQLGVLKAIGCPTLRLSLPYGRFGAAVGGGCAIGVAAAYGCMPWFYDLQNAEELFPPVPVQVHGWLIAVLIVVPGVTFDLIAVAFAARKLRLPALALMRGRERGTLRVKQYKSTEKPFLRDLGNCLLHRKKMLAFFFFCSAFFFSSMTQMALSMRDLSSESFSGLMLGIGLLLAALTLFLSLSGVTRAYRPTAALLRAFGFSSRERRRALYSTYRPLGYIGFALGTAYQYILLRCVMAFVFTDLSAELQVHLNLPNLFAILCLYTLLYEGMLFLFSRRVERVSLRTVMAEDDT